MIIRREASEHCLSLAKQYPVLTILGPRQSGKTTLAKELFKDFAYINLEQPDIREIAERDPRALLQKYPSPLIIDEVQRVPALLSYLQVIVDSANSEGMYVLTGSHQLELHQALSQSLAGRTGIVDLLPLTLSECRNANFRYETNQQLITGFYPRIYNKSIKPKQYYQDYIRTYVERDVRSMLNIKDLTTFQRFLKLCAARTGTVLNMNNISNDLGVSSHTVKHWTSILEASFLVTLLPPFFENLGKQLIKSPKLYFNDVGLACYLLGIETEEQADRDPLRGNIFETLVVMDLIKTQYNLGNTSKLYFYRDSQKNEVDLIYELGNDLIPIEIKSAQTMQASYFKGIHKFQSLTKRNCLKPYLVYAGEEEIELTEGHVIHYHNARNIILDKPS